MTNIRKLLGSNIRAYRNDLGISQEKLAEMIGMATNYLGLIEGGKKFPSPEMMERLARALEKDTLDLFVTPPLRKEQGEWKEAILADIEKLVTSRLNELRKASEQPDC